MASPRVYNSNFKVHIETGQKVDRGTTTTQRKVDTDPDGVANMESELQIVET